MSKQINVNPGHYKVAGREHQGDGILHKQNKQALRSPRTQVLPGSRNEATRPHSDGESGKDDSNE